MKTTIYDNGGKSFDRFSILIPCQDKHGKYYQIFGASEDPFSPLGFGQFCGEIPRPHKNLGKRIKREQLPDKVQAYIRILEA